MKDVEKDYWNPCGKVSGKMATVMRELEFDITDLNENFVYVFRVMAFNAIGEGEPLMTPCPTIAKFELDPPNQPYNINIVDFDKKWVKLDWTIPAGPKDTKYVVEKIETFLIPKDEEEEEEEEEEGKEYPPPPSKHPPPTHKKHTHAQSIVIHTRKLIKEKKMKTKQNPPKKTNVICVIWRDRCNIQSHRHMFLFLVKKKWHLNPIKLRNCNLLYMSMYVLLTYI